MSTTQVEWAVSASDYPRHGSDARQLLFCLRYAILAPSSQNSQPWRFRVENDTVAVFGDNERSLPVIDPQRRQLAISCGAAITNLLVALHRFGHRSELEILPTGSPDRLATIRLAGPAEPDSKSLALFDAIKLRRTNREPFTERPVSYKIADEFSEAAKAHGVRFVRLSPEQKREAAALIAEGDRRQLKDNAFRQELAKWSASSEGRRDGIPVGKKGFDAITKHAAPLIIRTFDRGDKVAAQEEDLATHSPVLAAFVSDRDETGAWVRCGLALEQVLLIAASYGISASYLNQPLELAALRPLFADVIGDKTFPQLVVRMGFGPSIEATPRRPLEDVLL